MLLRSHWIKLHRRRQHLINIKFRYLCWILRFLIILISLINLNLINWIWIQVYQQYLLIHLKQLCIQLINHWFYWFRQCVKLHRQQNHRFHLILFIKDFLLIILMHHTNLTILLQFHLICFMRTFLQGKLIHFLNWFFSKFTLSLNFLRLNGLKKKFC